MIKIEKAVTMRLKKVGLLDLHMKSEVLYTQVNGQYYSQRAEPLR